MLAIEDELAIETFELTKFFGPKNVVYNLNLKVPKQSIFGFLGPNGAGKTTTIKLILDLLKPTSGRIKIFGKDSILFHREIIRKIGYQPEVPILYESLTAIKFLRYMARLYGFSPAKAQEKARQILDFVGIGKLAYTEVKNFSAGQKQRLALGQALINDPELLILDEPTANLDPLGRVEIMDKIKDLVRERGITVFISSHILPEIERVCDHVAIINNGVLILQGKISEIVKDVRDTLYAIRVPNPKKLKQELSNLKYIREVTIKDALLYILIDLDAVNALWTDLPKILSSLEMPLIEFKSVRSPLEKSFLDALGVKHLEETIPL